MDETIKKLISVHQYLISRPLKASIKSGTMNCGRSGGYYGKQGNSVLVHLVTEGSVQAR
jgi:hypothetical protein